jgi:penicillin-binding protein 1A
MINLLESVVNEGTGRRLRFRYGFSGEMGGKTGTTQNFSDGWFIGLVPQLVGGAWTGGEDRV